MPGAFRNFPLKAKGQVIKLAESCKWPTHRYRGQKRAETQGTCSGRDTDGAVGQGTEDKGGGRSAAPAVLSHPGKAAAPFCDV